MFGSRPAQQQQQNRAPVIRRAIRGDMAPPPAPPLMPPPLAPASSYHTANTHAPTEADEATQRSTQEDDGTGAKPAEPADPFEGLWGKLVPCNSSMETIDLRVEQPQYIVGRSNDAQIQIPHPKISAYLSVFIRLFFAPRSRFRASVSIAMALTLSPNTVVFYSLPAGSRHCELRLVYNPNNTTTVTVTDFSTNGTYVSHFVPSLPFSFPISASRLGGMEA